MEEALDLIQELGRALTDHDHQWSDKLRNQYTRVTNKLKKEDPPKSKKS